MRGRVIQKIAEASRVPCVFQNDRREGWGRVGILVMAYS